MTKVTLKKSVLCIFFFLFLLPVANANPSTEPRASASVTGDMNNTSASRQSNNANPYQGEAPVASYAPADWQKAVAPAFKQVLIKTSGNANIAQIPAIRKALNKPNAFVQSYNYLESTGDKRLMLQVRFSQKAINTLLKEANQSNLISSTQSQDGEGALGASPVQDSAQYADETPQQQVQQETQLDPNPQRLAARPTSPGLQTRGAPIVEGVPVVSLDSNTKALQSTQNIDQAESFAAPVADEQFMPEGGTTP